MMGRLTAHEKDQVDLCDNMLDGLNGSCRIQHHTCLHPKILDLQPSPMPLGQLHAMTCGCCVQAVPVFVVLAEQVLDAAA